MIFMETACKLVQVKYRRLLCVILILSMLASIISPAVVIAQTTGSPAAAAPVQTPEEIKAIYDKLQAANSLNTGLNIEILHSGDAVYHNDGKTLKISSALVPELFKIDGGSGNGMALFLAREISYAENIKAGFEGFQLEYLSDKAGLIVANNARYKADAKTFYDIVKAVGAGTETGDARDKIRTLKIGVSQYVTPSDLARLMSNKLRRGVTIKKPVTPGQIGSLTGWQPVLKNAIGGAFSNVAVYYGLNVASNMLDGYPISQSMKNAVKSTFTPEYLLGGLAGSVVGGAIGSLAGSLIPIPGAGPILSTFISVAPAIFGANLGSEIGTNAILDYKRNKKVSLKRIWDAMDVSYLVGHSVGMAAGMAIGSALIPIPVVGGFIGGVAGGFIGAKVSGAIAGLYHKLTGKAKDKLTNNAPGIGNANLPWLKVQKDESSSTPAAAENDLSQQAPNDPELIEAQKIMNDNYQKYVKLLAVNPNDSPELQKALEDFNRAGQRYKQLKEKASEPIRNAQ